MNPQNYPAAHLPHCRLHSIVPVQVSTAHRGALWARDAHMKRRRPTDRCPGFRSNATPRHAHAHAHAHARGMRNVHACGERGAEVENGSRVFLPAVVRSGAELSRHHMECWIRSLPQSAPLAAVRYCSATSALGKGKLLKVLALCLVVRPWHGMALTRVFSETPTDTTRPAALETKKPS